MDDFNLVLLWYITWLKLVAAACHLVRCEENDDVLDGWMDGWMRERVFA